MSTIKAPSGASFRRFGVRNTDSERLTVVVPSDDAAAVLVAKTITAIPKSDGTVSAHTFPVTGETITVKRDGAPVMTNDGRPGVAVVLGLPIGVKVRERRNGPVTTSHVTPEQPAATAPTSPASDATQAQINALGQGLGQLSEAVGLILQRLNGEPAAMPPAPTTGKVTSSNAKTARAAGLLK